MWLEEVVTESESLKRAYSLSSVSWEALVHCECPAWTDALGSLAKESWSGDTSGNMRIQDTLFKFFIAGIFVPVTKRNNIYLSAQNLAFTAPTLGFKVLA